MAKLRSLTKDEQATISMVAEEATKRCVVSHTVKESKDDDIRYQLSWTFDFSNTSYDDVLKLATRTICIKKQAEWRKSKDRMDAAKWDNVTFMVDEVLAETRKSADPLTRAKSALNKLGAAERKALLEALMAESEAE